MDRTEYESKDNEGKGGYENEYDCNRDTDERRL
jgi:hypothetical protein